MKEKLFIVVLLAVSTLTLFAWPWSQPPEPPAKPEILDSKLETHFFSDNKLNIRLRNNGRDGWVDISYSTWKTSTDWEIRRRGGIERTITGAINGDDSKYHIESNEKTIKTGDWKWCTFLKANETKLLQLELPGHSSSDNQLGPSVTAVLSKPSDISEK